jgi:hypothetical protein
MSEEHLVIAPDAEEDEQGMANADMVHYWNGRSADLWVVEAARFDTMLAPFGRPTCLSLPDGRRSASRSARIRCT